MRRPSAPLVLSVAALVLAITGTAFAGGYIITSTKQIKPSVRRALKGNRGPRGYDGIDGANGAAGAPGSPGMSHFTVVDSPHVSLPPGTDTGADFNAQCPAGTVVVGTGFYVSIAHAGFVKAFGTFVGGYFYNDTGATATNLHMQAMCATVSTGATRSARAEHDQFAADRAAALAARAK